MSTGQAIELSRAEAVAARAVIIMRGACERIEIAGSLRRRCEVVHDAEIVCVPKYGTDLIGGNTDSHLRPVLASMGERPGVCIECSGPKYTRLALTLRGGEVVKLDVFTPAAVQWGVVFALRTGPVAFSKSLVTTREHGGRLRNGLRVHGGNVWEGDRMLPTPEELDFLELAGGWVEPRERR